MVKRALSPLSLLIISAIFIISGISLMLNPSVALTVINTVSIWLLIAMVASYVLAFVFGGKQPKFLRMGSSYTIFAALIIFAPRIFAASLSTFFGFFAALNGFVSFITFLLYRKDRVAGWLSSFFSAILSCVFAYLIFANPLGSFLPITKLAGLYLVLYGMTILGDFSDDFLSTDYANKKIKPRIYIQLPVFLSAFIPRNVLKHINNSLSADNISDNEEEIELQDADFVDKQDPILEVYVHIANDVIGKFGHVDICYDDVVYSYGCHDERSSVLMGFFSHGVLMECEKQPYLEYSIDKQSKTLIGFGVKLTRDQRTEFEKRLSDIKKDSYIWLPDAESAVEQGLSGEEFKDYASDLWRVANAVFYKFKSGAFKSYFALGTNCVLLAHKLVSGTNNAILSVNGFVTPGAYYNYLNRLYNRKNSHVVSKTIYKIVKPEEKI